jgi:hypothetical protein
MQNDKEKNSASGNRQSDFAGTNPDKYGAPKAENEQDNPINDAEAQNVTDGSERISGEEANRARNKATEGIRQGRDD